MRIRSIDRALERVSVVADDREWVVLQTALLARPRIVTINDLSTQPAAKTITATITDVRQTITTALDLGLTVELADGIHVVYRDETEPMTDAVDEREAEPADTNMPRFCPVCFGGRGHRTPVLPVWSARGSFARCVHCGWASGTDGAEPTALTLADILAHDTNVVDSRDQRPIIRHTGTPDQLGHRTRDETHSLYGANFYMAVTTERGYQDRAWGDPTDSNQHSWPEWQVILDREVGEVAQALGNVYWRGGDPLLLRAELIQVAAVCAAMVEVLDDRDASAYARCAPNPPEKGGRR